ncbi:DUF1214 domain-containing protein [Lysobacter niastensis]|uniref:DUF1254 domain-containing protein n=1 Tax=Lysobacter niastensis TaxID=380629 RepID=A0ABS0BCF2_9GAMM|nr:DUF1254 domain-containing protein [Lysobacter niastensis]MBF6025362.1 DUF1254 domain-containing protein [Lysobacter niastensis]
MNARNNATHVCAAFVACIVVAAAGCQKPTDSVAPSEPAASGTSQPADAGIPTSASASQPTLVTEENFVRAESDKYFGNRVAGSGIGKLGILRELMPIDNQSVIRSNRDTLYSPGVFDLEAGPVTVTLPDPGKRFMSALVIDQDEYALKTVYAPATFTVSKGDAETRYVLIGVRTFADPNDPVDMKSAHALQDQVKVEQAGTGSWDVPDWDSASQDSVRAQLIQRAATLTDSRGMFGPRGKVDPEKHLIGAASGWGGNNEKDALYLTVVPPKNDGKTVHTIKIKPGVPVDAFWSVSVYGPDGYFHKNDLDAYSVNDVTAKKAADGSVTIQFGGCDGKVPNCLPIVKGWSYWVRLYRPKQAILDGTWKFPEAIPAS